MGSGLPGEKNSQTKQAITHLPGTGKKAALDGIESYGLGLLLVRDICHRYDWQFHLNSGREQGSVAQVVFGSRDKTSLNS